MAMFICIILLALGVIAHSIAILLQGKDIKRAQQVIDSITKYLYDNRYGYAVDWQKYKSEMQKKIKYTKELELCCKVRNLCDNGASQRAIARELGIAQSTVSRIMKKYNIVKKEG